MLVGDTYTLINYVSFINYLCYGVTILGLLVLRWRRPALHRPIKVRASPIWASVAGDDGNGDSSFCPVLDPARGFVCPGLFSPQNNPMRWVI